MSPTWTFTKFSEIKLGIHARLGLNPHSASSTSFLITFRLSVFEHEIFVPLVEMRKRAHAILDFESFNYLSFSFSRYFRDYMDVFF